MGKRKGPYVADFNPGTIVRVVDRETLEEFRRTWKLHHPLSAKQLAYAGVVARVWGVGYYHGGDELYELEGVPGIWHECCLKRGRRTRTRGIRRAKRST